MSVRTRRTRDGVSKKTDLVEIFSWVSISHGLSCGVVQLHTLHISRHYSCSRSTSFRVLTGPVCLHFPAYKCPSLSQILSLSSLVSALQFVSAPCSLAWIFSLT